jgi:hypothetical protein
VSREEYSSDDEDDEKKFTKEDEGFAVIAITTPTIHVFDTPNENLIAYSPWCLMAKVIDDFTLGSAK